MSGFIQSGAISAVSGSGSATPTITGVTAGNCLISTFTTDDQTTLLPPLDSAGQTWSILAQSTVGGSTLQTLAIAYLLNANAGAHNLTWTSQIISCVGQVHEVNGVDTDTGMGTPVSSTNDPTGTTTLTCGPYTPLAPSELVIAIFNEEGSAGAEGVRCTTAAFQTIGSSSDAGAHPCLMIEQNGISFMGAEANAAIVVGSTPLSATWTWTASNVGCALIAGLPVTVPAGSTATVCWII